MPNGRIAPMTMSAVLPPIVTGLSPSIVPADARAGSRGHEHLACLIPMTSG
jgi:hypothetical protein